MVCVRRAGGSKAPASCPLPNSSWRCPMAEAIRVCATGTAAVFLGMGLVYLSIRVVAVTVGLLARGGRQ